MKRPTISVIGLGFVGLTLAVVNARKGFNTIAIDIDKNKLRKYQQGIPDFYEPQLESYMKESVKAKKIVFTDDLNTVLKSDITFLTVGTPSLKNGKINLEHLKKAVSDVAKVLKKKHKRHIIIIKSTVIPTTTNELVIPLLRRCKNVGVVVNPEFLREGNAINDLLNPYVIVIGSDSERDGDAVERYYRIFYKKTPEILRTRPNTAEVIKYANNVFLATKISFINSIANICGWIPNTDVNVVADAIGKDPRIGSQFLKAGPGFGGSCLPKDLSALIEFSNKFGNSNTLFKAVKEINEKQPNKILELMKEMKVFERNKTIAILGLAFKRDTDDIREAVSVKLVNKLITNGLKVRVHDPMAINNFKSIFGNRVSYCETIGKCLKGANCCILITEWDQYKKLKPIDFTKKMNNTNIIDARRILDPEKFSNLNFKAIGLGNRNFGKRENQVKNPVIRARKRSGS